MIRNPDIRRGSHCRPVGGSHGLVEADGAAQPAGEVDLLRLGLFDEGVHLKETVKLLSGMDKVPEMRKVPDLVTHHQLFQVCSLGRVLYQTAIRTDGVVHACATRWH